MLALRYVGCLALLAGSALGRRNSLEVTSLKPIAKEASFKALAEESSLAPSTNVGLDYGLDAQPLVHVDLQMQAPSVLLEEVDSVSKVECANESLAVSFASVDGYKAALATWSSQGDMVFFTNHLGNCDTEAERGVFLVNQLTGDEQTLTITAHSEKKDVASTAAKTSISFQGLPAARKRRSAVAKRGITLDEKGLTIGGSLGLPAGTSLYSFPPYLDVSADEAEITASVTFSGYVDYSIITGKLNELYVDVDSSIDAQVGVTVAVTAEYRDSFSYSPGDLSYMIIDVPGIISLGPELLFSVGLDLDVGAGATVKGTAGAGLKNGSLHLDFLDMSKTKATPWTPTHNARLDLSERAEAKADTWVDVTFQLNVEVLGGVVDVSAGLSARPKFNNEFALTAGQVVDENGTVTEPNGEACAQGLSVKSDFSFILSAFVSSLWSKTLYNVQIPIAEECYTWK